MTPEKIAELIPQALTGYYGHKCKDFDDNCICCQAWAELSRLTRERDDVFNVGIEVVVRALQAMKPEYNDGPSMHVENMTLGRAVIANRAMLDASPGKKG